MQGADRAVAPMRLSKSAIKATLSRQELKLMKKQQKQVQKDTLNQQAEALLGVPLGGDGASKRAVQEALREHKEHRNRRLVRISSAIAVAAAALAVWAVAIAATVPARAEHGVVAVVLSPLSLALCVWLVGLCMRYKTTGPDGRTRAYRGYGVLQFPPLRLFAALLLLHMWCARRCRPGAFPRGWRAQRPASRGAGSASRA